VRCCSSCSFHILIVVAPDVTCIYKRFRPLVSRFLQVRENWKKSGNLSGQGGQWKVFFGKVMENEKLVPPDAGFSGKKCIKFDFCWGCAPDPAGGELTALPQPL